MDVTAFDYSGQTFDTANIRASGPLFGDLFLDVLVLLLVLAVFFDIRPADYL